MRKTRLIIGTLFFIPLLLAGCQAPQQQPEPDYAPETAEIMLQAMSDGDYASYIEHFAPELRSEITESEFAIGSQTIKNQVGEYISKEYVNTQSGSGVTNVFYRAQFSDEPDGVSVRLVFQEVGGQMYVVGFWLDSPKLRSQ